MGHPSPAACFFCLCGTGTLACPEWNLKDAEGKNRSAAKSIIPILPQKARKGWATLREIKLSALRGKTLRSVSKSPDHALKTLLVLFSENTNRIDFLNRFVYKSAVPICEP
jgi:hypothetical protein